MTGVMTELRRRAHIDAIVERVGVFAVPSDWNVDAPCIDKPDGMFFPSGRGRDQLAREGAALCSTCAKHAVCLIDAITVEQHLDVDHVHGRRYLSGKQRRELIAARRTTPTTPDGTNRHDDLALMLALCTRIAHNLNNDGDPQ